MKTSPSNELLGAANAMYPGSGGGSGLGDGKSTMGSQQQQHHHHTGNNHHQRGNLTSSDIDTLKMREIEELNVARIKKKSEKMPIASMGRNQQQKGGGGGGFDSLNQNDDSDDYINLNDCSSKKGFFYFLIYFY